MTDLVGVGTLSGTKDEDRHLPVGLAARTMSIIASGARTILGEIAYIVREDLSHARISRDPKDWERD